ncbi:hypothetical protein AB205_0061030 [Aquarana catesbeiana]|uniref:Uncharacterized protein n=1 Tax=Aquarana catesbeiana TaxID=8400 RepID=A0A2G9QM93_AQUCT|nr:hypothetical protein AB205_0061030 [Aquarana catesbeiana]
MFCKNMYISVLHFFKKCIALCLTGKKIKLSKKRKSRIVHSEHGEGPEEHDPDPSKKKRLTMDKGVVFCQSSQGPCISAETDYVEEEDSGHMTLEESSNHDLPKQD